MTIAKKISKIGIALSNSKNGAIQNGDHLEFLEDGSVSCREAGGWLDKEDAEKELKGVVIGTFDDFMKEFIAQAKKSVKNVKCEKTIAFLSGKIDELLVLNNSGFISLDEDHIEQLEKIAKRLETMAKIELGWATSFEVTYINEIKEKEVIDGYLKAIPKRKIWGDIDKIIVFNVAKTRRKAIYAK